MKKTFKKLVASLMAVTTLVTGMTSMIASAANTEDTGFTFGIDLDQWLDSEYTDGRQKTNATSVYVRLDTPNKNVKTQTQGSYDINYYWSNYTSRGTVTIRSGRWEIYNNIYESLIQQGGRSKAYARLKMWAADEDSTGNVSGVWSPDTAGNYTVAT